MKPIFRCATTFPLILPIPFLSLQQSKTNLHDTRLVYEWRNIDSHPESLTRYYSYSYKSFFPLSRRHQYFIGVIHPRTIFLFLPFSVFSQINTSVDHDEDISMLVSQT